ncbi:MAG: hypothetical protein RDV48_07300 [Candidatus Eremiobacteraeota bacterium]|nr:hypothetical protein [Candidatus Eremiobacteraeota bacterium]
MTGIFDKADITVTSPFQVNMGDEIPCEVTVTPQCQAKLRKIEVGLFCKETGISRGTSDSYYRKDVYTDNREAIGETTLMPGIPVTIKEAFSLPTLSAPTYNGKNHMVNWELRVRLDVPWWPDTRYTKEIIVSNVVAK